MAIIIQRPTLILKDEPNIIKISRAAVKSIPMVSVHPYFKKVRNWKHIAMHFLSEPENQHEVILFDGSLTEPESILSVSPKAHNIFVLEAIVLHDYDNGWLTIPKEFITEANSMELSFDSRYRQPNIDAVIQNDSEGYITWDAAKETDLNTVYNLNRKIDNGPFTNIATITGNRTYIDAGLEADTTYTYQVQISDITKYIPPTDSASIKPVRPATPINLKATTTPGQVTTSWSPIAQSGVTYNLYRSEISGVYTNPIASGITGNGYIDNNVVSGVTYYYMVKAVKTYESLPSAEVSIKPIGTFSITNVIPTSTTSVRVDFSIAAGADSYNLFYKNATAASYTQITGAVSPKDVSGLTEGETYQFYGAALNAYSSYTTSIVSETLPKTSGVPTSFVASQWLDGMVKLKWATTPDADQYWIYKASTSTGSFIKIATVTGLSYDDTSVVNGSTYYYKISGVNLHEGLEIEGFKSGTVTGYPNKVIANLTKSNGTTTTKTPITYTAFTNAPAGLISKIEIRHFNKSGVQQNIFTSNSGLASYSSTTLNLDLYTEFAAHATVYMNNPDGNQTAQSSTIYYITSANIPKMTGYTSTFDHAKVNWQAGNGNDSYVLYRATTSAMTGMVELYSGNLLTYTDTSIPAGVPYYYAVKGSVSNVAWTGATIGLNPPPISLQSDVSALSAPMVASRRVYNRPDLKLNIYGSQCLTSTPPYSRTGINVSYVANSEYYNNIKILKSTNKTTWTPTALTNVSGSSYDLAVTPGQVMYYKVEATEIKTGNVYSKILGIVPIDATFSAINISGSVSLQAISQCYSSGPGTFSGKMHRLTFTWNKNPPYATHRTLSLGSIFNDPYYAIGNGMSIYREDVFPDEYVRQQQFGWYRIGYTESDGTVIVSTHVTAFNAAKLPTDYYGGWNFGPVPTIPC